MKKQVFALLAGGALLAFTGIANAGQPLRLTDNQMDGISAGAVALADAASVTFGEVISNTYSQTSTESQTVPRTVPVLNAAGNQIGTVTFPRIVVSQAFSQGVAAGGFLFNAQSASAAQSYASWAP
jgi:hypothetical protein